jgi:biopolymer transport protein ExbB
MSEAVSNALEGLLASWEQHIEELMAAGGPVMWPLLGVSVLLWTLLFERGWYLYLQFPLLQQQLSKRYSGAFCRIPALAEMKLELHRNMRLIRTLTGILPMLGLLGTVTGIVQTFDLIRLFGSADASIIAQGVSQALITTLSGLVMGLFGLGLGHQLSRRVRSAERALTLWAHAR